MKHWRSALYVAAWVVALALFFAAPLLAQPFRVCSDPRTHSYIWSDAAECNEVTTLSTYPCDLIRNLPHCEPPATATFRGYAVPFDAPVRFAGVTREHGRTYWTWLKAGDPSRPCTAAEASEQASYGRACAARAGDVLFLTVPVYVP